MKIGKIRTKTKLKKQTKKKKLRNKQIEKIQSNKIGEHFLFSIEIVKMIN